MPIEYIGRTRQEFGLAAGRIHISRRATTKDQTDRSSQTP
jgi:hypothetical protein